MDSFFKYTNEPKSTKFVLKGINPSSLERQYLINEIQDFGLEELSKNLQNDTLSRVTTSLENVGLSKTRTKPFETIVINDELHIRMFITPNTTDKTSSNLCLNKCRKFSCWYCRHNLPYDWHPLGIPLKYKKEDNAFECDGVFCSFNCMVAYLLERNEYRYKDSSVLILLLYRKCFNSSKYVTQITPSPSWKLLKEYGGHLSIEEYRKCIQQHIEYKTLQQMLQRSELKLNSNAELFIEV